MRLSHEHLMAQHQGAFDSLDIAILAVTCILVSIIAIIFISNE